MPRYSAMVRRRRDGRIAFDLDLVHAGVVVEALEQTRQVLLDGSEPKPPVTAVSGAASPDADEFAGIVAGLGGLGEPPGAEVPETDPVLRRLLPDAFRDDPEASAEFRRFTSDSVRGRKLTAIDSALADLTRLQARDGGVVLEDARARAWLTALNDARLALGTRLAIVEDDDLQAELDAFDEHGPTDPAEEAEVALRAYRIAVYDFLSGLLDMVVRALDR